MLQWRELINSWCYPPQLPHGSTGLPGPTSLAWSPVVAVLSPPCLHDLHSPIIPAQDREHGLKHLSHRLIWIHMFKNFWWWSGRNFTVPILFCLLTLGLFSGQSFESPRGTILFYSTIIALPLKWFSSLLLISASWGATAGLSMVCSAYPPLPWWEAKLCMGQTRKPPVAVGASQALVWFCEIQDVLGRKWFHITSCQKWSCTLVLHYAQSAQAFINRARRWPLTFQQLWLCLVALYLGMWMLYEAGDCASDQHEEFA